MDFYIFDKTETLLYVRNAASESVYTEEEYRMNCVFPLVENKVIERGMFIGFYDIQNVFQMFEVREVINRDPEMEQEISCEHVFLADLMDDVVENTTLTNVEASAALTSVLAYTRWALGTSISTALDGTSAYYISAWESLLAIKSTWNIRLKPRLVLGTTTITARYVDMESSTPVNRGVRLHIGKNIEQIGVTYDDRSLYTALYGRGASVSTLEGENVNDAKVTFEDIVWSTLSADPANKPAGQKWVEDTAATALYGRNGRKRTGVVEFSDITDPEAVLQATWDYLQTVNHPSITIDTTLSGLASYGYAGELILLGDEVAIIDDALGIELLATVIGMQRDLIQTEQTNVVIGSYRSNLEYLVKESVASAGTVNRMTNSNPELVNGFVTNVNGATGTFNEIVQKSPTNENSKIHIGEYNNTETSNDPHSGMFWGGQKLQYIAVDSYGILRIVGEAGLVLATTVPGGALVLHSYGDIHLITETGYHVYANGVQLD